MQPPATSCFFLAAASAHACVRYTVVVTLPSEQRGIPSVESYKAEVALDVTKAKHIHEVRLTPVATSVLQSSQVPPSPHSPAIAHAHVNVFLQAPQLPFWLFFVVVGSGWYVFNEGLPFLRQTK